MNREFMMWYVQHRMGVWRLKMAAEEAGLIDNVEECRMTEGRLRDLLIGHMENGGDVAMFDEPLPTGDLSKMLDFLTKRRGRKPAICAGLKADDIDLKPYQGFNGLTNWSIVLFKEGIDKSHAVRLPLDVLDTMAFQACSDPREDWAPRRDMYVRRIKEGVEAVGGLVLQGLKADDQALYIYGKWVREFLRIDTMREAIGASALWRPVRRVLTENVRVKRVADMLHPHITCESMIDDIMEVAVPFTMGEEFTSLPKQEREEYERFYRQALRKVADEEGDPASFYLKLTDGCVMLNKPVKPMQMTALVRGDRLAMGKLTYGYDKATAILHDIWGIDLRFGDVLESCFKIKPEGDTRWATLSKLQDTTFNYSVSVGDQWERGLDPVTAEREAAANGWASRLASMTVPVKSCDLDEFRAVIGEPEVGNLNLARKNIMRYIRFPGLVAMGNALHGVVKKHRVEGVMTMAVPALGLLPGWVDNPQIADGTRCLSYRFPIFHVMDAIGNGGNRHAVNPIDQLLMDGDFDGDLSNLAFVKGKKVFKQVKKEAWTFRNLWLSNELPWLKPERYDAEFNVDNFVEFVSYVHDGTSIGVMDNLHSRATFIEKGKHSVQKYRSKAQVLHREARIDATKKLIDQRKHRLPAVSFEGIKEEAEKELEVALENNGPFLVYSWTYGGNAVTHIKNALINVMAAKVREGKDPSRFEYWIEFRGLDGEKLPEGTSMVAIKSKARRFAYRPFTSGDLMKEKKKLRDFAANLAYVLWFQIIGNEKVFNYLYATLPKGSKKLLAQSLVGIPSVPQFRGTVREMGVKLLKVGRSLFGPDRTKAKVEYVGVSDSLGGVFEISTSSVLDWLNDPNLIRFEQERKAILQSGVCGAQVRWELEKLFKTPRTVRFWLQLVIRQFCLGSMDKLKSGHVVRHKQNGKVQTAYSLGIVRAQAGNYINSYQLFIDSMHPKVADIVDRVLGGGRLPNEAELDEIVESCPTPFQE